MNSKTTRWSTREKKQAEHFGHFEPSAELEELLEASIDKPSLIVKLPLPSSIVKLPLPSSTLPLARPIGSSQASRKRSHAMIENTAAPKRQRARPSAPRKKRGTLNAAEDDDRPDPRGQPEVWAEVRQALCDSLPYYRAHRSGAYTWGSSGDFAGYAYGFLLDNDNDEHGYMSEKVVVSRLGGGMEFNEESGKMEQTKNHSASSNKVRPFWNNKQNRIPLVLIAGTKNTHCPIKLAHRYNVLGHYHVTDLWSENVNGKVVCRVRFEMIELKTPSWFGIQGSPLPPRKPDYATKAALKTCSTCSTSSKEVLAVGWMCLNDTCTSFSKIDGTVHQGSRAWNPAFINERTKWPAHSKASMLLKPDPPTGLLNDSLMGTSVSAWKGMVCRDCGRCNSRIQWDQWKCQTDGCEYEVPISYNIIPRSALAPDHSFEAEGHSIPFNKYEEPVICTDSGFHGYWRKMTYELSAGNYITHYIANQVINRQSGGADEILEKLQGAQLGMQRFSLVNSQEDGDMITKHFGMNFGLPYKYVVAMESRGFSEAPPAILNALNHLTWAGEDAVTDGSYRPFNELLCLAYMEDQEIGYHDDGEKDLGPDIASLSLGGAATMKFRTKSKHWTFKERVPEKYDPDLPVQPGSQAWKTRIAINELYRTNRMQEYEDAKALLFKSLPKSETTKKNGPVVLTLELRHGDMVVMHGDQIQKIYEHAVQPKGKLRYGLTGRYIKPENIPQSEHWKGEFSIPSDEAYDGDLGLFQAHYPESDEDEDEE